MLDAIVALYERVLQDFGFLKWQNPRWIILYFNFFYKYFLQELILLELKIKYEHFP